MPYVESLATSTKEEKYLLRDALQLRYSNLARLESLRMRKELIRLELCICTSYLSAWTKCSTSDVNKDCNITFKKKAENLPSTYGQTLLPMIFYRKGRSDRHAHHLVKLFYKVKQMRYGPINSEQQGFLYHLQPKKD